MSDGAAWSGAEGARAFASVEAATDWLVGYPFVFRALSRQVKPGDVLVDYGCGPGRVAARAARALGVRILGADVSPAMLEPARRQESPGAEYHLVEHGRVAGVPDGCADAAMCNHVLASLPDEQAVVDVLGEIRRLLRPGGLLALLATDPACAGVDYASLRVDGAGGAGDGCRPGQEFALRLRRTDGSWQTVRNYAWPVGEQFVALVERAGFAAITQWRPSVAEAEGVADAELVRSRDWAAERERPPLVVTTALAV